MEWFIKCIKQYADFKGRARREEYWMFYLACFLIGFVTAFLGTLIDLLLENDGPYFTIVAWICIFFTFIPSLAVGVRRLHDIGKSGWWMLLVLIPYLGSISLIILFCLDSQPGTNKWGENPKEVKKENENNQKVEIKEVNEGEKKPISYNKEIQDTFLGVKFGISKQEVINIFEKKGFFLSNSISDDDGLCFIPADGVFSFGGFDWQSLCVFLSDNKFYAIQFGYCFENKEMALSRFDTILSKLSSKYKMNEIPSGNINTYKHYCAYSVEGNSVSVGCSKNFNTNGETKFYVVLIYTDDQSNKINDEL